MQGQLLCCNTSSRSCSILFGMRAAMLLREPERVRKLTHSTATCVDFGAQLRGAALTSLS